MSVAIGVKCESGFLSHLLVRGGGGRRYVPDKEILFVGKFKKKVIKSKKNDGLAR